MAQVTIAATSLPNWKGATSNIGLAVLANRAFTSGSGTIHLAAPIASMSAGSALGSSYYSFPCSVDGSGNLQIPQVTLDSTTDAADFTGATYAALLYNTSNGKVIQPLGEFTAFGLTPTPTNTTWGAVAALNVGAVPSQIAGFVWMGAWSGAVSYPVNAAVNVGGSSYIALQANANVNPTTDTGAIWAPLALAGSMASNVTGQLTVTQNITAGGVVAGHVLQLGDGATIADASGNQYGAAFAIVDNNGAMALAIMQDGSTRLFGSATVYGNILMGNGQSIQTLGSNALNALWAVMDSASNVALYVDNTGNTATGGSLTVGGGLSIGSSFSAPALAVAGSTLAALAAAGSAGNQPGYVFAIMDAVGKLAFGIDGSGYLHGHFAFDPLATASQDAFGGVYYSKRDASGYYQIFYMPAGGVEGSEAQLTNGAYNSGNPAVAPDGSILFISDSAGQVDYYRMGPSGENPVPITGSSATKTLLQEADYNVIILTGQSVSNGFSTDPGGPVSTAQPFSNLMLGPDPRCGAAMANDGSGTALDPSSLTLQPLVAGAEVIDSGAIATGTGGSFQYYWGETQANGIADSLTRMWATKGHKGVFIVIASGGNGDKVAYISKNGLYPFYSNVIAALTKVQALATASGKTVNVRAVVTVIGDGDQLANTAAATFQSEMVALQANYEADCKAITGQKTGIPLIQSTNAVVNSATNWIYISEAQIELSENPLYAGKVITYGPRFQFPYCDNFGSNYAHMTAHGYRNHGENIAKAVFAAVQNKPWTGTRPKAWQLIGNRVIVDFHVPVAPLVIDTTTLAAVPTTGGYFAGGMYGFEFQDGSATPPTITAVNLLGATTVEIILSAVPTGSTPVISYATHAPTYHRAYGNLRDSDASPSLYGYTNTWNWCPSFSKALSY